jgi:hypothetical protein
MPMIIWRPCERAAFRSFHERKLLAFEKASKNQTIKADFL